MAIRWWNIEWLDGNAQRSYPLTEWATKVDTSDSFRIPDALILGLYFPVAAGIEVLPDRFFISRIVIYGTGIAISVGYDDDSGDPPIVGTAQFSLDAHEEYDTYALPGRNEFADSVGRIIIGNLATLSDIPVGRYDFTPQAGALEADAIQPMISGVTALVIDEQRYQGDIVLEAGANIRYTVSEDAHGRTVIRIDALSTAGFEEPGICGDRPDAPPIRTIDGIAATATGDFSILGNTCLEPRPVQNGLQLADVCSEPCCGCEELEALVRELELFGTAATTVQGFTNRLQSEVTQMHQVVLGSLLGDRGCNTCRPDAEDEE